MVIQDETAEEEVLGVTVNNGVDHLARIACRPCRPRYEAVEQLDYDRHYTLRCALEVGAGELRFDFEGTDPQARSFVNCALACAVANVHNIVTCQLLPDIIA